MTSRDFIKDSDLKEGDKVRLIGLPGRGDPNYYLHPETRRVYEKLLARGRSLRVRIRDGMPWIRCRFKRWGRWEHHELTVRTADANWVLVKSRQKKS